jgi:hypothetical protein
MVLVVACSRSGQCKVGEELTVAVHKCESARKELCNMPLSTYEMPSNLLNSMRLHVNWFKE